MATLTKKQLDNIRAHMGQQQSEFGNFSGLNLVTSMKVLDTCDDLAKQRDKAAKLMTEDGLHAGQELSATKSSNKGLREQRTELQRDLGVLAETLQRMEDISSFGDQAYDVRERELEGWDGPKVVEWGEGCAVIREMTEKYKHLNDDKPDPGEDDD